jgi:hypothetical protein
LTGDAPVLSTASLRSRTSILGIGMRTGQTSPQAPHSDEAPGSAPTSSQPRICGIRISPIGPG